MDLYKDQVKSAEIALLSNNGVGNVGIPIRCDHFIITLCIKGSADRRINNHSFRITEQSVHMILPGQIHSFDNATDDFEIYILLFTKSYLAYSNLPTKVLENLFNTDRCTNITLSNKEFEFWTISFMQMNEELDKKKKYHHEIINTSLINLLWFIKREVSNEFSVNKKSNRQEEIFSTFKKLIEAHFQLKKSTSEYAEILNITSKHLSETIKKLTGQTALYYIHERIIHEAEYLLVYSDLSVKEIANHLYFDTPSHFGRLFKKIKDMTPLKFRSKHK